MSWEDVPQIDEAFLSAGPCRNQILPSRFVEGVIWHRSKKHLTPNFWPAILSNTQPTGQLRSPNLSELMCADRLLMEKNCQRIVEENWNLDDALHEYSTVRHDVVAILRPRPRISSAAAPMRTPPPLRRESKGKSDRKGVKKGEAKAKAKARTAGWTTGHKSWFTQGTGSDGQTKPICVRYNLTQCTSQKCAFVHYCPVPKSDGTMCGSTDHKAISCPHRSRRVSA